MERAACSNQVNWRDRDGKEERESNRVTALAQDRATKSAGKVGAVEQRNTPRIIQASEERS